MRDYIISGVPLRDPQGQWWIDYTKSSLVSETSRAIVGEQPYGYHGDPITREGFFKAARETLVFNIVGTSKDDYASILRGFLGLLNRPEYPIVSAPQRSPLAAGSARQGQSFNVAADLQRQGVFRMIGNPAIERHDEASSTITAILENRLAFWSSVSYYTTAPALITTANTAIDLKPTLLDSDAPAVDGLVRIKGPITLNGSIIVRDRATSRNVKYTALSALGSSQYVVIDLQTMKAQQQSSDTWAMTGGTDVSSRLDVSGPGQMSFTPGDVVVFPSSLDYAANVVSSGHGTGTAVEIRLRRSYLS